MPARRKWSCSVLLAYREGRRPVVFVRVTRGCFSPDTQADVQRISEEVAAAARRLPGFHGYQGGLDRGAGRLVAITTWDTMEHAAALRNSIPETVARLLGLGVQLEPAEIYQITVQG
jgi:heme-degrading monooxygenase HmoA